MITYLISDIYLRGQSAWFMLMLEHREWRVVRKEWPRVSIQCQSHNDAQRSFQTLGHENVNSPSLDMSHKQGLPTLRGGRASSPLLTAVLLKQDSTAVFHVLSNLLNTYVPQLTLRQAYI